MNRDTLKQIMIDQKDIYLSNPLITRQYSLEDNVNYCFVGIRRTGKSYMMYQQIKNLQASGIPLSQIVYVNFEDERLLEMTSDDLNTILEIGLEISGIDNKPYFFLDEIQNIASTLGGRFMILHVYPYSFSEYLIANGKDKNYLSVVSTRDKANVLSLFNEYITYGAFPELVEIKNKRDFLSSIYQTVYLGDIITRNNITNTFAIKIILKKIAESITKPLSFNRLTNIVKSTGISLAKQTLIHYVNCMTDSYLLFALQNYAAKLVKKETFPKYYFMDTGLLGLMLLDCKSAQLENLVAIELVRRFGVENVYFFENNVEIDFYVPSENLAIQVCMQVLEDIDTKERETRAFAKLSNFIPNTKCMIITNSEESVLYCNGLQIQVIPIWKWLLK